MEKELIHAGRIEPVSVAVDGAGGKHKAAKAARQLAESLGFRSIECEEIALAVSELAANVLKHAGGGLIQLRPLQTGNPVALEVISEDQGPGLLGGEQALADGYSTAGTLGAGLGAVNRLMDTLEFSNRADGGLRIVCQRRHRPRPGQVSRRRLEFGAATRAARNAAENGDAFVIHQWENHALAGVIDGLGHGVAAQRASQAARQYIEQHFDQPIENLFLGAGRACRGTRGVVMALARFDLAATKFTLGGIGNIEVRLLGDQNPFKQVIRRGVVGLASAPKPVPTEHAWSDASVLILHSDGISSGWRSDEIRDLPHQRPAELAHELLERFGRADDDATVLVARNKPS